MYRILSAISLTLIIGLGLQISSSVAFACPCNPVYECDGCDGHNCLGEHMYHRCLLDNNCICDPDTGQWVQGWCRLDRCWKCNAPSNDAALQCQNQATCMLQGELFSQCGQNCPGG